MAHAEQVSAFPRQEGSGRQQDRQGGHQGREGEIEVARTDGNGLAQGFTYQGIERAEQDRSGGRRQQDVVEDERALATDRGEKTALRQPWRAPGKKRKPGARGQAQNDQQQNATLGVYRKRMHRGQHA